MTTDSSLQPIQVRTFLPVGVFAWIALAACLTTGTLGQSRKNIVASIKFAELESEFNRPYSSLAFVDENTIGLVLCASPKASCQLRLLSIEGDRIATVGSTTSVAFIPALYPAGASSILASRSPSRSHRSALYNRTLDRVSDVLSDDSPRVSNTGKTVASFVDKDKWRIYRLQDTYVPLRDVTGLVMSVSDEFVAIQQGDKSRVERLDGSLASEFAIKANCNYWAELIGEKLLVYGCGHHTGTYDLKGQLIVKLRPPHGWGTSIRQDQFGSRLLWDNWFRAETASEKLSDIIPSDYAPSNSEAVRVVDTVTGRECFDWQSLRQLVGDGGDRHADISPSGFRVAIATADSVTVYALPQRCGN